MTRCASLLQKNQKIVSYNRFMDVFSVSFDGRAAHFCKPEQYCYIEQNMAAKGKFPDETYLRKSLTVVDKNSVVVDCGAYVGTHTVFWAQRCKKVIAVEPQAGNVSRLLRNLELNNLTNVEVVQAVLSDKREKLRPRFTDPVYQENPAAVRFEFDPTGRYESQTLDALVDEHVDFVKVDVEGFEVRALSGASRLLGKYHPVVSVELHLGELFGTKMTIFQHLVQVMGKHGYRLREDLWVHDVRTTPRI